MLVLSRRRGEKVIITCPDNTKIAVEVIWRRGFQMRLGFTAPKSVRIARAELETGSPTPTETVKAS